MSSVFFCFRDAPQRRRALDATAGSAERYVLYGLDQLAGRGWKARHNLEQEGPPPRWARWADRALRRTLEAAGGYAGDFATVLGSLRRANRSDVVFSTVDTVGIPLMLAKRLGLLRPPLVYAAIGLPERLVRLRSSRMRRLYARALGSAARVLAYSEQEAGDLRTFLAEHGQPQRVEFVPFGVDSTQLSPSDDLPTVDVVSIGADPHRDYELLLNVAASMPAASFRIVTTDDRRRSLPVLPGNVAVETDVQFEDMRRRLVAARAVALPVRDNSYSGATTVLLQAMALAKPVVVSATRAIATGYGLVDRENCRLVPPGDVEAFRDALNDFLGDDAEARALGARARASVEGELTWERFVDRIEAVLVDASEELGRFGSESR